MLTDLDQLPGWATTVVENHDTPEKPLRAGQSSARRFGSRGKTSRRSGRSQSSSVAGTGALAARRRPGGERPTESLGPELRRLAWSAGFLLTVAGTLLASGLYH